MSTFAVSTNDSQTDIIGALNYALANLGSGQSAVNYNGNVLVANVITGQVSSVNSNGQPISNTTISYLYGYINVMYSNSATGGTGFSSNSKLSSYYGIRNTATPSISLNPVDYTWYQVSGGFGSTKSLWYETLGGGQIKFGAGTSAPTVNYASVIDSTPILLATLAPNTVTANTITAGSVTNVAIAANTITGNNIQTNTITGQNIQANTITGQNIQSNTITGNLIQANTIQATSIVSGSITTEQLSAGNIDANVLVAGSITSNEIAANAIIAGKIAADAITSGTIAANAVTAGTIAANSISSYSIVTGTITGDKIAGNTITGNLIQANTIQGSSIVAGSITADQLAANLLIVGNIQSIGATIEVPSGPGYWLDYTNGNVYFGGNTQVGNNLTVGNNASIGGNASITGLVTAGTLNANTVNTGQLVINSATQTITVADNHQYPTINFVNGAVSPTDPGYIWPNWTRGFAIGGGATISTTTEGSLTGSSIMVNYNAYIFSAAHPEYNVVELWKSGQSAYYRNTFRIARASYEEWAWNAETGANVFVDTFTMVGDNGIFYFGNIGNISTAPTNTTNTLFDGWTIGGGLYYAFGGSGEFIDGTLTNPPTVGFSGNIGGFCAPKAFAYPLFDIYAAAMTTQANGSGSECLPVVLAGGSGYIAYFNGLQNTGPGNPVTYTFQTTGVYSDLYDIAIDIPYGPGYYYGSPVIPAGTSVDYVAVGTGGTILYSTKSYSTVGNIVTDTGWASASTPTVTNLNGIASNWTQATNATWTRGNLWVAVGDYGTIMHAPSGSGPWTMANTVPTGVNLNSVAYTNGYWVAVGDKGTIITSTDAIDWTGPISNMTDGSDPAIGVRNLYGVAGGPTSGKFVVAGEEIIMASNIASPTGGWNAQYLGGTSVNSNLTRLQYYGSWANIANVTMPPTNQQVTNGQIVSGTFTDTNYSMNEDITYYLVLGNMFGNVKVTTNSPTLSITEMKR